MRAKVLVQLQSIRSGAVQEKDWTSTFAQMISLIDAAADPTPPPAAGGKKGAAVGVYALLFTVSIVFNVVVYSYFGAMCTHILFFV